MKRVFFVLVLSLTSLACKKDDPDPAIESIVGKWRLDAYEKMVSGEQIWEKVPAGQSSYLTFRFDGVMLDSKDLPMCCAQGGYYLNGAFFGIKPKSSLPHNPQCGLIDCIGCSTLNFEQAGDELIITYCPPISTRAKYVKI